MHKVDAKETLAIYAQTAKALGIVAPLVAETPLELAYLLQLQRELELMERAYVEAVSFDKEVN